MEIGNDCGEILKMPGGAQTFVDLWERLYEVKTSHEDMKHQLIHQFKYWVEIMVQKPEETRRSKPLLQEEVLKFRGLFHEWYKTKNKI